MIKPHLNYRMKKIHFSYESISGRYEIYWNWENNKFNINISIPYGTEAEIILPNEERHNVTQGNYHFECNLKKDIYAPFSIDNPIIDIIKNNEGIKIIKELLPKIYETVIQKDDVLKKDSIKTINLLSNFSYNESIIQKCDKELSLITP